VAITYPQVQTASSPFPTALANSCKACRPFSTT
jgi:hypothetical protein